MIKIIRDTLKNNPYILKYYRILKQGNVNKQSLLKTINGKQNLVRIHNSVLFSNSKLNLNGSNNLVVIENSCFFCNLRIDIKGNNNKINISQNVAFNLGGEIYIEDNNCEVNIGVGTTFENAHLAVTEDNSKLIIGNDCMFANGIDVRTGDSHSILNKENGKRMNYAANVIIGNHVWIASQVSILKGSQISADSVVATRTVVTKKFMETNILLGGIPAKVLKNNINWDRNRL